MSNSYNFHSGNQASSLREKINYPWPKTLQSFFINFYFGKETVEQPNQFSFINFDFGKKRSNRYLTNDSFLFTVLLYLLHFIFIIEKVREVFALIQSILFNVAKRMYISYQDCYREKRFNIFCFISFAYNNNIIYFLLKLGPYTYTSAESTMNFRFF